jgi:hypothetical protein
VVKMDPVCGSDFRLKKDFIAACPLHGKNATAQFIGCRELFSGMPLIEFENHVA